MVQTVRHSPARVAAKRFLSDIVQSRLRESPVWQTPFCVYATRRANSFTLKPSSASVAK